MIDWTPIMYHAYWPIFLLIVILIFRNKISKLIFRNDTMGEILLELNSGKSLVDKKYNKVIKNLDSSDLWLLYDLEQGRYDGKVTDMNPVQKFVAKKLLKTPFIKMKPDEAEAIIQLTEEGKKILRLTNEMKI
ncbi:hypothetical protein K8R42_05305 [bacterium]|nr:hypothetical protein [bacterium]